MNYIPFKKYKPYESMNCEELIIYAKERNLPVSSSTKEALRRIGRDLQMESARQDVIKMLRDKRTQSQSEWALGISVTALIVGIIGIFPNLIKFYNYILLCLGH